MKALETTCMPTRKDAAADTCCAQLAKHDDSECIPRIRLLPLYVITDKIKQLSLQDVNVAHNSEHDEHVQATLDRDHMYPSELRTTSHAGMSDGSNLLPTTSSVV